MEKKNINLVISVATFILGTLFILTDDASITANVIGESGGSTAIASIIGIFLIIFSAGYFILLISHTGDHKGGIELDRLVRESPNNHEEIVRKEIYNQDIKTKAGHDTAPVEEKKE